MRTVLATPAGRSARHRARAALRDVEGRLLGALSAAEADPAGWAEIVLTTDGPVTVHASPAMRPTTLARGQSYRFGTDHPYSYLTGADGAGLVRLVITPP